MPAHTRNKPSSSPHRRTAATSAVADADVPSPFFLPEHPHSRRIRQHAQRRGVDDDAAPAAEWLARAREFLRLERKLLLRNHRHGMSGIELARWRSTVLDVFLEHLLRRALRGASAAERNGVALMAHGGYGRGELCPFSDVDLMLIYDDALPGLEAFRTRVTNDILYPLWDLKLKPGHASRTIAETVEQARADAATRNTLLDARHVAGSRELSEKLVRATDEAIRKDGAEGQVRYLLDAQKKRHERFGGGVFMQEPDIKGGVGGLRDFHTLLWLARLHGARDGLDGLVRLGFLGAAEARNAVDAYSGLLRIRHELHFQSGRPEEVLSLEKQPDVAAALGCEGGNWMRQIEVLMRHYYQFAETVLQTTRAVVWRFEQTTSGNNVDTDGTEFDGFVLRGRTLSAGSPGVFQEDPSRLLRVFRLAQEYHAHPDFPLLRLVRENIALLTPKIAASRKSVDCFLAILADAGRVGEAIAQMHESGVLCRFIPEFAGIHCLVQREIFHRYTVDVHTLLCLRELDAVFAATTPPVSRYRDAILDTDEPALLYLALLLHDIGKQHGVAGHARTGAEIAERVLRRLGVRGESRREVVALIREHLEMGAFCRKHDLEDPENLAAFAAAAGTAQHLRYLYVLTYCDARATAPELWNDYKNSLHTQLFRGALRRLERTENADDGDAGGASASAAANQILREIRERNLVAEIPDEEILEHLGKFPEHYVRQYSAEDVALHLELMNDLFFSVASAQGLGVLAPAIHWEEERDSGVYAVTLATWDHEGLFYKLAGAFTVSGLDILSAKVIGHADHIALDTFRVAAAAPAKNRAAAANTAAAFRETFAAAVEEVLVRRRDDEPQIRKLAQTAAAALPAHERRRRASVSPRVTLAAEPARHRTIVELEAADRTGLLFFLARIFFRHRLNITFARITTGHSIARDTFYLEPFAGEADKSPEELATLKAAVEAEFAQGV